MLNEVEEISEARLEKDFFNNYFSNNKFIVFPYHALYDVTYERNWSLGSLLWLNSGGDGI